MKTLLRIIAMVALTFLMLSLTECESPKSDSKEVEKIGLKAEPEQLLEIVKI